VPIPPLITADDLAALLATPAADVRVVDATTRLSLGADGEPYSVAPGHDGHLAEHVPGAVFADLAGAFSDPDARFAFTLPSAERFAAAAGALGIGDGTHVVAYDTGGRAWATRLWWLLRVFGHDAVSVLDGGLAAWTRASTWSPAPTRCAS
jgi:thiosulfate/3-mercaptopyruvate sulfurtransferase